MPKSGGGREGGTSARVSSSVTAIKLRERRRWCSLQNLIFLPPSLPMPPLLTCCSKRVNSPKTYIFRIFVLDQLFGELLKFDAKSPSFLST